MNIKFNTKIPKLYDFLRVIVFKSNDIDFLGNYTAGGFEVTEKVNSAIEYIWKGLDLNVLGVSLFFKRDDENSCFMYSQFDKKLHEIDSINELIDMALNGPVEDLQLALLKFYDHKDNPESFYNEILHDKEKAYTFINSLKLSLQCKWELTGMINSPVDILEPLGQFLHRVKRRLSNVYKENGDDIRDFQRHMLVMLKNDSEQFIKHDLSGIFDRDIFDEKLEYILSYSFLNEFLMSVDTVKSVRIFILGISYEKTIVNMKHSTKSDDTGWKFRQLVGQAVDD